jgi:hypothetical protein
MNRTSGGDNNYCGGIAGLNHNTSLTRCSFTGNISIPETFAGAGDTYAGGLGGSIEAKEYNLSLQDCWASGKISAQGTSSATMYIGGAAGLIKGESSFKATIQNCRYEGESLSVTGRGWLLLGGFAGSVEAGVDFTQCYSLANRVSANRVAGMVYAGGFTGRLEDGTLSYCYAGADIDSFGMGTQFTGGLAGYARNSDIKRCYATGAVKAVNMNSTGNAYDFSTGGLAGRAVSSGIQNCYALGRVFADSPDTGPTSINAGGLVGYFDSPGKKIEYSFAAGSVQAGSNGTGAVYAGGVAGYVDSGSELSHSAALQGSLLIDPGAKIIAQGGGNRNAGRVYGDSAGTTSTNYAYNLMLVDDATGYHDTPITNTVSGAANNEHGSPLLYSQFRQESTWTTLGSLEFNKAGSYDGASPPWSFGNVSRGYPTLAGLGGQ